MGAMTTPVFWSGQDRVLTVEDMEDMPDDEFRYELDDAEKAGLRRFGELLEKHGWVETAARDFAFV